MRRAAFAGLLAAAMAAAAAARAGASLPASQTSRVVDRIVAQIEGDIILQSQVRELGSFQQLIEGRAESDDRLLAEIIEQWVVQTEAAASQFAQPAPAEVDRELTRLVAQFESPTAYAVKLNEAGLSAAQVRQILARQIYIERYVDYKFRPSVQIEPANIEAYYRKELLPELARKNQSAPALNSVEEQIRELLTQRAISDLASKWLEETKSRLKIELKPSGATRSGP
jgi:hypothetical protein